MKKQLQLVLGFTGKVLKDKRTIGGGIGILAAVLAVDWGPVLELAERFLPTQNHYYSSTLKTTVVEDVSKSCSSRALDVFQFRSAMSGGVSFGEIVIDPTTKTCSFSGKFFLNGTFQERTLNPKYVCIGRVSILGTTDSIYTEWKTDRAAPGFSCPDAPYRSNFELWRKFGSMKTIYY